MIAETYAVKCGPVMLEAIRVVPNVEMQVQELVELSQINAHNVQ
jgi:hypothetical protein